MIRIKDYINLFVITTKYGKSLCIGKKEPEYRIAGIKQPPLVECKKEVYRIRTEELLEKIGEYSYDKN